MDATGRDAGPGPLSRSGFRWYLTARTVSLLGSGMMPVAMTFAVLKVSGSAGDLGAVHPETLDLAAARQVPQANRAIEAAGEQALAVGRRG